MPGNRKVGSIVNSMLLIGSLSFPYDLYTQSGFVGPVAFAVDSHSPMSLDIYLATVPCAPGKTSQLENFPSWLFV